MRCEPFVLQSLFGLKPEGATRQLMLVMPPMQIPTATRPLRRLSRSKRRLASSSSRAVSDLPGQESARTRDQFSWGRADLCRSSLRNASPYGTSPGARPSASDATLHPLFGAFFQGPGQLVLMALKKGSQLRSTKSTDYRSLQLVGFLVLPKLRECYSWLQAGASLWAYALETLQRCFVQPKCRVEGFFLIILLTIRQQLQQQEQEQEEQQPQQRQQQQQQQQHQQHQQQQQQLQQQQQKHQQ